MNMAHDDMPTRQDRRSRRQKNRRKMAVHGRSMKRRLGAAKRASESGGRDASS